MMVIMNYFTWTIYIYINMNHTIEARKPHNCRQWISHNTKKQNWIKHVNRYVTIIGGKGQQEIINTVLEIMTTVNMGKTNIVYIQWACVCLTWNIGALSKCLPDLWNNPVGNIACSLFLCRSLLWGPVTAGCAGWLVWGPTLLSFSVDRL